VIVGAQGMWQDETQVNYFGLGSNVIEDDRSQYRFQTHDVVGYATYQPTSSLALSGEFGWLGRPKVLEPGGSFKGDFPDTRDAYPTDPAVSLATQPSLLRSEAAITADTRDHRGYPLSGFVYRAAVTHYMDRSGGTFSFREYQGEALQIVPLVARKWTLVLHGWAVAGDLADGHEIPFYLLPALGGTNTLRGYHNFQFHDTNSLLVNAESRLRLTPHIDMAVFADAGNVGNRFADLNLDKTSYGVGLRLHTTSTTIARMDVARGDEGWRVLFRTTEPFRLARIRRHVAVMPFMP
jgi:outer membrane protein assembly factor BamA